MHEQGPHLWVRRQSFVEALPLLVVCGVTIQAAGTDILSLTSQANIDECLMQISGHTALLFWTVAIYELSTMHRHFSPSQTLPHRESGPCHGGVFMARGT